MVSYEHQFRALCQRQHCLQHFCPTLNHQRTLSSISLFYLGHLHLYLRSRSFRSPRHLVQDHSDSLNFHYYCCFYSSSVYSAQVLNLDLIDEIAEIGEYQMLPRLNAIDHSAVLFLLLLWSQSISFASLSEVYCWCYYFPKITAVGKVCSDFHLHLHSLRFGSTQHALTFSYSR